MRVVAKILLLLFLVSCLFYGVLAFRYWRNPPQLKRNIAAELNAPVLAKPEDQRAWPIYREVLLATVKDQPKCFLDDRRSNVYVFARHPGFDTFVEREAPQWERVRKASLLPSLGFMLADQYSAEDRRLSYRHSNEYTRKAREAEPLKPPDENP